MSEWSKPATIEAAQDHVHSHLTVQHQHVLTFRSVLWMQATQQLQYNELSSGISGWGATDPQVFTARLAKVILSKNPPRHYQDGWLWRPFYLLGHYSPLWFTDLLHRVRLRLF
jgi:hypothetical protein